MPKLAYIDKRFNVEHMNLIEKANAIIAEYQAQGWTTAAWLA